MSQNGEFYLDTELNTEGVKKGAQEINKAVDDAAKNAGTKFTMINGELVDITNKTQEEVQALKQATAETNNLASATKNVNVGEQGQQWIEVGNSLINVAGKTQEEIDKIIEARTATQEFAEEMAEVQDVVSSMPSDAERMAQSIEDFLGNNTAIDTAGAKDLAGPNIDMAALDEYLSKAEQLGNTIPNRMAQIKSSIQDAFTPVHNAIASNERLANTVSLLKSTVSNAATGIKNFASALGKAAVNGVKLVGKGIANGIKKIGQAALMGAKNLLTTAKANKKAGGGFKSNLKTLLKYGLGISSLFVLFNKLRAAITDGMKNLVKYDKSTNASISSVVSALATLKNALATAFAPILNVVAPILTSFINKLVEVANTIGAVIAKLTGKSTFTKAIAVQKNYAASLDNTGKSASKSTLSIDELNQSVTENNEASSGGAGSGEMFEETPIDDNQSKIADWLKSMWENADFTELGAALGQKLANALDNIDWTGIQAAAGRLGKGIATLINGFVEVPDLGYKIGNAIAQSFNTALEFAYQFVTNLHWESLGQFIGDTINGFFENVDWLKLADTFSLGIEGVLDSATATFETVDWQMIGDNLSDAIAEIDFGGIAKSFFTMFGAALASAVEFIWGFIEDTVKSIRDYFMQYIQEYIANTGEDNLGKAVAMGILQGILDAYVNIGTWIYENILIPFVNGFKDAFEIHSPSHVMAELAGYIVDGFFEGLKGLWDKVKSVFETFKTKVEAKVDEIKKNVQSKFTLMKTNIQNTISSLKNKVLEIFDSLKNGIKVPINGILGFIERFCNGIIKGINKAIEALNSLKVDAPQWVTDLTGVSSFGINIPTLNEVSLPRLATGTVVPRQASEFAAILGDNNQETEVVSPLSTIREAVAEVMEEYLAEIAENTRELADKDFSVTIGDKEIARANRRGEKQLGLQIAY